MKLNTLPNTIQVVPNGYNIAKGGQGGPLFAGKKHTADTIAKIQDNMKKYYDDPEYCRKLGNSIRKAWANPEMRQKLSNSVKYSEKFRKAVEEGRIGGASHKNKDETRKKLVNRLKNILIIINQILRIIGKLWQKL